MFVRASGRLEIAQRFSAGIQASLKPRAREAGGRHEPANDSELDHVSTRKYETQSIASTPLSRSLPLAVL